ncbi:MAG: heme ABC exporter ATP-binding protein CcmA, partial [Candidatus Krumholzibacteriota bacterium]|nr:heme ABC exporter ATP-binding protein CcmA [Candidatus Krumholzibacteriota bacterium]
MTADGPATLACSNLTRKYGHLVALRSVSLSVAPGECLTLFGHNGAGKSTLLGVAAGLSRNYEGDVFLFGKNLRGAGDDVRASVGFVAHETFLYNDLTALENLIFFGRLYCVPDPRERAGELLERFGLVVKSRDSVRSLSRGMKQRLSLARAVVHDPGLLLLDEPFTGLDERACDLVSTMVRELVKNGGSALVTTHDIDRGLEVATRATILDHGAIVYQTDPHAI